MRISQFVKKLVTKLPPDVLAGPLPFPDRLDYAEKLIQEAFDASTEELLEMWRADYKKILEQRDAWKSAFDEVEGQRKSLVLKTGELRERLEKVEKPVWIVNDNGELGVKLGNRFFFLYKGDNIEYEKGAHDDGTPMLYRYVGKREFGETCHPECFYTKGWSTKGRYLEPCIATPGLSDPDPEGNYEWKPIPALSFSSVQKQDL